ncbi:DNA polymerase, partial [Flavobacteriaceae bacterium]|nr:DNA polymerase [Flavobacteriaceae bacterium]
NSLSEDLNNDIERLQTEIFEAAGETFNIASPKQLGVILFEKMKLIDKPKKTKTGQYSTAEDVLSYLAKDRLYGFEINQVVSVLLFANDTRNEKILCLSCGKKAKLKAILITFFAGWWSRRGIFLTPWIVIKDSFNFLFINKISDKIINRLIDENTGHFRRKGTENGTLNRLIKNRNEKEILEDEGYDFT